MITIDNYEEYLVMHADGELQPHEEEALQVFLDRHPHLKSEMAAYEQVKLVPDEAIVYTAKDTLLKPVPAKRIALIPGWRTLSAAAGIAALVVISVVALRDNNTTTKAIVAFTGDSLKGTSPVNNDDSSIKSVAANNGTIATEEVKDITPKVSSAASPKTNNKVNVTSVTTTKTILSKEIIAANTQVHILPVEASSLHKLPVEEQQFNALSNISNTDFAATTPEAKETWIDKLPLDEDKKEQLNNLASSLATGVAKAGELRSNLNEARLTIRVEKRKLILSF